MQALAVLSMTVLMSIAAADQPAPQTSNPGGWGGFGGLGEPDPRSKLDPGFTANRATPAADSTYNSSYQTTGVDADGNSVNVTGFTQLEGVPDYDGTGFGGGLPDFHTVATGDTLWGVSEYYFRDPYLWPKVWSYNDHITNAHWIFPGDRIRLMDPYNRDPEVTEADPQGLIVNRKALDYKARRHSFVLTQYAYIDADRFQTSMRVVGSSQAKVMMGTLDTVYLKYRPENPPIPGERLMVYAPLRPVYDISIDEKTRGRKRKGKRNILGWVVEVLGEIEVANVDRKAAEGLVAFAAAPIERNHRVGELRRRFRRIETVPGDRTEVGYIVEVIRAHDIQDEEGKRVPKSRQHLDTHALVGEEQFVVTNLGGAKGVKVGNVFEVVRKGDEYTPNNVFHIPYEDGWPRRAIATAMVVDVQEKSSLAVVTFSAHEVEKGDHIELVPGTIDAIGTELPGGHSRGVNLEAFGSQDDGHVRGKASFSLGGN